MILLVIVTVTSTREWWFS